MSVLQPDPRHARHLPQVLVPGRCKGRRAGNVLAAISPGNQVIPQREALQVTTTYEGKGGSKDTIFLGIGDFNRRPGVGSDGLCSSR
jgi:hypothetical protein